NSCPRCPGKGRVPATAATRNTPQQTPVSKFRPNTQRCDDRTALHCKELRGQNLDIHEDTSRIPRHCAFGDLRRDCREKEMLANGHRSASARRHAGHKGRTYPSSPKTHQEPPSPIALKTEVSRFNSDKMVEY